jgi:uncharacterized protein (UPF0276 family)
MLNFTCQGKALATAVETLSTVAQHLPLLAHQLCMGLAAHTTTELKELVVALVALTQQQTAVVVVVVVTPTVDTHQVLQDLLQLGSSNDFF